MINNPVNESKKGDIIIGLNNHNKGGRHSHPIIFIEADGSSEENFIGAMLTHSSKYGNTNLEQQHFLETDDDGNSYEIVFDNSFIVSKRLIKRIDWAPFEKKGQLSEHGITFVDNLIGPMPAEIYFDNA